MLGNLLPVTVLHGHASRAEWLAASHSGGQRDGDMRDYLAVVGPVTLTHLVTYHRQDVHRRRWVYRDDIL